jgi:subfamily B ATP-binding cassette protein MsbA
MSSSDRGSKPPVPAPARSDAWQTYRRLIGYLRPHRGMFLLGVLGALVFSASMVSFTAFAKVFGDGTFENRDPRTIVWLPLALIGLFLLRGLGDLPRPTAWATWAAASSSGCAARSSIASCICRWAISTAIPAACC